MALTLYGIPNCDTVKKARRWLDEHGVAYAFHDYRKDGLDPAMLDRWVDALGWEKLLNKSGTTFRKLPDADKAGIDAAKAKALMLDQPARIVWDFPPMTGNSALRHEGLAHRAGAARARRLRG